MNDNVYGYEMARIAEVYFSMIISLLKNQKMERGFYALLYICDHNLELTQQDLAKAIRKDKVQTMRIVDHLSENGWIIRKKHEQDKRCQILEVTLEGFEQMEKVKKAILTTNDIILKDLSEKEKRAFQMSMNKIYGMLSTLPDPDFFIKAIKRKNE